MRIADSRSYTYGFYSDMSYLYTNYGGYFRSSSTTTSTSSAYSSYGVYAYGRKSNQYGYTYGVYGYAYYGYYAYGVYGYANNGRYNYGLYSDVTKSSYQTSYTSYGLYAYSRYGSTTYGVYGYAYGYGTTNSQYGGYLRNRNNYAYVGAYYASSTRKIYGTGSVSEIIPTKKHGRITLTCSESPEYWYTDYGQSKIVNGKAHVDIDPIMLDIAVIDKDNPIKIYVQLNDNSLTYSLDVSDKSFDINILNTSEKISDFGTSQTDKTEVWVDFAKDFSGKLDDVQPIVSVTSRTAGAHLSVVESNSEGFKVKSDKANFSFFWSANAIINKTTNVDFNYMIVVKPKTNYGEGRFMQAPGPGYIDKDEEPEMAKAKNQGTGNHFNWPKDYEVYGYEPAEYTSPGASVEDGKYAGYHKDSEGKLYSDEEWQEMQNSKHAENENNK